MERCLCSKSSLWVNQGKVCDSTLNLFNIVVHFDDARGFGDYIESVEMCNYYKSIPSGFLAARMTYLCVKYKIPKRADLGIICTKVVGLGASDPYD